MYGIKKRAESEMTASSDDYHATLALNGGGRVVLTTNIYQRRGELSSRPRSGIVEGLYGTRLRIIG